MIKLSAIYKCVDGCNFDQQYYLEKHIPMAREILKKYGLVKMEADIFNSFGDLVPVKYFAMTHAFFEDDVSLSHVLSQEDMGRIVADVENYTDVIPSLQTSNVIGEMTT